MMLASFLKNKVSRTATALGAFLVGASANASTTSSLPWDGPLTTLQNSLTGPVATAISVIAFLAAGAALVFGEELGGIAKKAMYVVLGVSFMVLGNKFLSALGLTGSLVF